MTKIAVRFPRHCCVTLCAVLALTLCTSTLASGQREKVLYSFGMNGSGVGDGDYPRSGLTADGHGNLYGTTYYGGADGLGTVFQLSPPTQKGAAWSETILHNFPASPTDGALPIAGVILDKSGNIYGSTSVGGANGLGMVYELVRPSQTGDPWTESVIYNFADSKSGTTGENGGGVAFVKGSLFVVTLRGGNGNGNVLEFKPPLKPGGQWRGGQIFAFSGGDGGGSPLSGGGPLIGDAAGNLYGTAFTGTGIVFELSPPAVPNGPWTETVLSFLETASGASLIFDQAGNLYGTASPLLGVGTSEVFELSPPFGGGPWTKTVLYSFTSTNQQAGYNPYGGLVFDGAGNLYGTTADGGSGKCNCGTVFKLSPGPVWTETILRSFGGAPNDGAYPFSALTIDSAGHLYGTTTLGGAYGSGTSVGGTVFEVVP